MPRSTLATVATWSVVLLLGVAALAAALVYAASEWRLRRRHDVALAPFAAPAAPDTVEARRLAILVGCLEGCHGPQGEGGTMAIAGIVRNSAPTLSAVLPQYDDAELARLVRFGVKRDGRSALGMPSATFYPLSDDDLGLLIGYLRRRAAYPPKPRTRELTPRGRLAIALGKWRLSADAVDPSRPRWGELPRRTAVERGRYLASVVCTECHGLDLRGDPYEGSPSLPAVVRGYRLDQFRHLLRTGVPTSGRDLGIMSEVAREAFSHFTDAEARDLHEYLRALPPTGAR